MNEYQEKLERVAKAAKVIFDVTTVAGIRTKQIECPHGNIPSYPTHAWWCDKCFWELEEALQDLESFQQSVQADGACESCKLQFTPSLLGKLCSYYQPRRSTTPSADCRD